MMRKLAQLIRGFRGDARGVSAVEFALIAPVLIVFYFGIAELTQAMMADRRVGHVASSIGDLVAQDDTITDAEMTDIFKIGGIVMSPFSTTSLKMRVSEITSNAANVSKVTWSDASNNTALVVGTTVTPPAGIIAASQSVIMAEVSYTYDSPVDYVMPAPVTFTKVYYLRPRRTDSVTRTP
ncbi:MAG: pilus assembly protein TadE [Caulobacter sp.]|jgi:Flp pilus assembly protein TadG|nr:pilus assembly protein TadE [Caulobacter sp.]